MHGTTNSTVGSDPTYQMVLEAVVFALAISWCEKVAQPSRTITAFILPMFAHWQAVIASRDRVSGLNHPNMGGPMLHTRPAFTDFSQAVARVTGKYNATAAFGCCSVTSLHFEGPENTFLNFTNFPI